jgi:hypothetical protein
MSDFGFHSAFNTNTSFGFVSSGLSNGTDPDALEFITNWEANTSAVMPNTQRLAVIDWYKGMKGHGTTYGTDLLSIARSVNTRIYILIPLDDSNASASAYELDAVSNGVLKGSYVNMVAGDFTPQGVTGGTGKYFDPTINLDGDYVTNYGFGIYCRTDQIATTIDAGQNSANYMFTQISNDITRTRIGSTSDFNFSVPNGTGFIGVQTTNTVRRGFNDGVFNSFNSYTKGSFTSSSLLFHAYNGDSPSLYSNRSLSFYYAGMKFFNNDELADFYTVIQRLQSNVIPSGRHIGNPIPPIS